MNDYKTVTDIDAVRRYLDGAAIVAFDFETAPDEPYRREDKADYYKFTQSNLNKVSGVTLSAVAILYIATIESPYTAVLSK